MRSLFLLALLIIVAVYSFGAPVGGVLTWTWLTLMTPHKLAWGGISNLPINQVVAILTLTAWVFSREPKRFPINSVSIFCLLFVVQLTLSTFISPIIPDLAFDRWDRTIKVIMLGFVVAMMMTEPKRLHALAWIIALSLGYFGVKGGLGSILTAGHVHVIGPLGSSIYDNNYLALAICMTLPLMYYLLQHSSNRLTRIGLIFAMVLSAIGVMGTYSRGGFVGLLIMGLFLWWRSRRRVLLGVLALAVMMIMAVVMPASWKERMQSLGDASAQVTFLQRLDSWKVAYRVGLDHPLLGGGFGATEDPNTYRHYSQGESPFAGNRHLPEIEQARVTQKLNEQQIEAEFPPDFTGGHAVHNIYLQVLADHGFPGLVLFVFLMVSIWFRLGRIKRLTRGNPEQNWARDLAGMLQISMITYLTAGISVSMPYYDLPYLFMGIALAAEQCVMHSAVSQNAKIPGRVTHNPLVQVA